MANPEHLAKLLEGVEAWNKWREEKPSITPDLKEADLLGAHLEHADFHWAHLEHARLDSAHLENAYLFYAHLEHANLDRAHLEHANLRGADLTNANVLYLSYLGTAPLKNIGPALSAATSQLWNWLRNDPIPYRRRVKHLRRWLLAAGSRLWRSRHSLWNWLRNNPIPYRHRVMRKRYHDIRGLDSCHGNRIFVRDASDQDYLDTVESQLKGQWGKFGFWLWGLTDYGRSIMSVVVFAAILIFSFGKAYSHWPQMISAGPRTPDAFTPYYFSIVTYTTLGFGDVKPNNMAGEILVSIEVIFGYVTLGLLLAVLGNKVARRS